MRNKALSTGRSDYVYILPAIKRSKHYQPGEVTTSTYCQQLKEALDEHNPKAMIGTLEDYDKYINEKWGEIVKETNQKLLKEKVFNKICPKEGPEYKNKFVEMILNLEVETR